MTAVTFLACTTFTLQACYAVLLLVLWQWRPPPSSAVSAFVILMVLTMILGALVTFSFAFGWPLPSPR